MTRRTRSIVAAGLAALATSLAPAPRAQDDPRELRKLVQARVEISQKIADFYADPRLATPGALAPGERVDASMNPLSELSETWMRRRVDARLDAANSKDERLAILNQELERTRAVEARIRAMVEADRGPARIDAYKAEFYRLDAQYRLAKEQAAP